MGEHIVARLGDIPDGRGLVVTVGRREIGLFRVVDDVFALRNVCPHQAGPIGEGGVFPRHCARVGADMDIEEYFDHSQPVVACPWHGWEFDLRTGVCLADPTRRVGRFETIVRDDEVVIVLPDDAIGS